MEQINQQNDRNKTDRQSMPVRTLARCALFTALIAIGAFLRIPTPLVPITLQTLFVLLAGQLLGKRPGAFAAFCYMALGLFGLPVFTEGGGFAYALKPSFGYIIGFCIGAYVTGTIARSAAHPTFWTLLLSGLAGLSVIYTIGVLYYWGISALYLKTSVSARSLLLYCLLLPLPGDLLTAVFSAFVSKRLIPILDRAQ